jgi:hypothetical protein
MVAAATNEGARRIWHWLCYVLADGAELELEGVIQKLKERYPTNAEGRRAYEALVTPLIWGLDANGFALGSLERSEAALMRDGTVDDVLAKSLEFVEVARHKGFPGVVPLRLPRMEALLELFCRQLSSDEAVAELEKLVQGYVDGKMERRRLALDEQTLAVHQALMRAGLNEARAQDVATALGRVFAKYPQYRESAGQLRRLKAELYKHLLPAVGKNATVEVAESILRLKRAAQEGFLLLDHTDPDPT